MHSYEGGQGSNRWEEREKGFNPRRKEGGDVTSLAVDAGIGNFQARGEREGEVIRISSSLRGMKHTKR